MKRRTSRLPLPLLSLGMVVLVAMDLLLDEAVYSPEFSAFFYLNWFLLCPAPLFFKWLDNWPVWRRYRGQILPVFLAILCLAFWKSRLPMDSEFFGFSLLVIAILLSCVTSLRRGEAPQPQPQPPEDERSRRIGQEAGYAMTRLTIGALFAGVVVLTVLEGFSLISEVWVLANLLALCGYLIAWALVKDHYKTKYGEYYREDLGR